MIHLFVTLKGRTVGRFDFDSSVVRVGIGRHPDNEVHIDSMAISRHHCALNRTAEGWEVADLGSNNGTFVNGSRISRASVRNGDALSVGTFQVSLRIGDGSGSDRVPVQSTPQLQPRNSAARTAPVTVSPELKEVAATLKGWLEVEGRPGPYLVERDLVQLGSAPGVDLAVPQVPEKLALLVRGYGGFQLVRVGGQPDDVKVGDDSLVDRVWLADGQRIAVGGLAFVFHLGLPDVPPGEAGEGTIEMQVGQLDLGALRPPSNPDS